MDTPGKLVREVRQRHRLTQAQLGALMGIAPNHIAMIERGERPVTDQFMRHLELLDRILTVEPEYRNRAIIKGSPEDDLPPPASIVVHPIELAC